MVEGEIIISVSRGVVIETRCRRPERRNAENMDKDGRQYPFHFKYCPRALKVGLIPQVAPWQTLICMVSEAGHSGVNV